MDSSSAPTEKKSCGPAKDLRISGRRPSWVFLFSLILVAVLLFFVLRGLDWVALWVTVKSGHYEILFITIPIASINYFIRALRWSIIVSSEKKTPLLLVFWANMVGYMGNAFLPARAGELLRSAYLGRKTGLGTSFVLATAMAERVLDAIALVLVGSVSLLCLGNISPWLANAVRFMALAGTMGLAIIIIAPFQEKLILRIFRLLPLSLKTSRFISGQITRFLLGMRSLRNGRRLLTFLLLTGIIWLVDAIGTIIGVRILSQTLNLGQALILLSALGLSSAIPSTPGYVGVYQFVAVTVLVPFGFSRVEALGYILISQVLGYLLFGFWGLLGLWQLGKN